MMGWAAESLGRRGGGGGRGFLLGANGFEPTCETIAGTDQRPTDGRIGWRGAQIVARRVASLSQKSYGTLLILHSRFHRSRALAPARWRCAAHPCFASLSESLTIR